MSSDSELILTPKQQAALNDAVDEASQSLVRAEIEKNFRKDVAERVKDEIGVPTARFNSLVRQRHCNAAAEAVEKHQETVELDEMLRTAARNKKALDQQVEE
ncbi:MAG: hypothetical protein CMF22_11985 [Idiomarinaceae bacterium]|nr:hypothetical protein [Idiomarinaceae bacterium]|tara:strand:+ start:16205 stop:16510 length:306 start_codon:yes stop_codon:yes gene_type:complete